MDRALLLVCHVPDDHVAFVRTHGLVPTEFDSWKKRHLKKQALKELILAGQDARQQSAVLRSVSPIFPLPNDPEAEIGLFEYFAAFFRWSLSTAAKEGRRAERSAHTLVVNLMAFHFPTSVADKIIRGLRKAMEERPDNVPDSFEVSYLTRNAKSFQDSLFYRDTVRQDAYRVTFTLLDYKGLKVKDTSQTFISVPRTRFRAVLALKDEEFYRKLIYETNSYLGHFVLSNSHVRTHYDLKDFVRKDDVFEELFARISAAIAAFSNVVVVYAGLETAALRNLANQLIRYGHNVTQAIGIQEVGTSDELAECDGVLLLTDIVNSGKTSATSVALIRTRVPSRTSIVCYSIIRMQNSPSAIDGCEYVSAVTIRRDYYSDVPGKCRLCILKQPETRVNKCEDFYAVRDEQLTPLDFWEIVHDCKALRRREDDVTGRVLAYRVESKHLLERYSQWLRNVVRSKYDCFLEGHRPSLIVTVDEPGGQEFAGLVSDALLIPRSAIRSAKRSDLERDFLEVDERRRTGELLGDRILLTDDGINRGETIRYLAAYCTKRGGEVIGAMVFDSRLDDTQNTRLRTTLGRAPLISLYRWAGRLVRYPART